MNLSMKQTEIMDIENTPVVAKGEGFGVGWSKRLVLADISFYIYNG